MVIKICNITIKYVHCTFVLPNCLYMHSLAKGFKSYFDFSLLINIISISKTKVKCLFCSVNLLQVIVLKMWQTYEIEQKSEESKLREPPMTILKGYIHPLGARPKNRDKLVLEGDYRRLTMDIEVSTDSSSQHLVSFNKFKECFHVLKKIEFGCKTNLNFEICIVFILINKNRQNKFYFHILSGTSIKTRHLDCSVSAHKTRHLDCSGSAHKLNCTITFIQELVFKGTRKLDMKETWIATRSNSSSIFTRTERGFKYYYEVETLYNGSMSMEWNGVTERSPITQVCIYFNLT